MEKLGARRERIVAALGPMISQSSYEVGAEFVAQFTAHAPDNARFFTPSLREGHAQFDLPGYIAMRLTRAGIAHVEDLKACTYAAADRFYSYRRSTHRHEPDYGRHINAIAIMG
jgi:copper oxidase (laccase) domain-containing protein